MSSPTAPGETVDRSGENPLPSLTTHEVFRSKAPILLNPQTDTVETVQEWGNYTLISVKGVESLILLDDQGDFVRDFCEHPQSAKKTRVNWRRKNRSSGTELDEFFWSTNEGGQKRFKKLALNPVLRISLKTRWGEVFDLQLDPKTDNQDHILGKMNDRDHYSLTSLENATTVVLENGRYLVLYSAKPLNFIAFDTAPLGTPEAPRNWKRFDLDSLDTELPAAISDHILQAHAVATSRWKIIPLNPPYVANVKSEKIQIGTFDGTKGTTHREETIVGVGNNVCVDPTKPSRIYFSRTDSCSEIVSLDLEGEPSTWRSQSARLPQAYEKVEHLKFDPSGRFLTFITNNQMVFLDRFSLVEAVRMPTRSFQRWDAQGRIQTLNDEGHLVTLETNLADIARALDAKRASDAAAGIDVEALFEGEAGHGKGAKDVIKGEDLSHFEGLKTRYSTAFNGRIDAADDLEKLDVVREALRRLKAELQKQSIPAGAIAFITGEIEREITVKQKALAEPVVREALSAVHARLDAFSLSGMGEIRGELSRIRGLESLVEPTLWREIEQVSRRFREATSEFFRTESTRLIAEIDNVVRGARTQVEAIDSKPDFDDWAHDVYPALRRRLADMLADCPTEAMEARAKLQSANQELRALLETYEARFEQEYATLRERAAGVDTSAAQMIKDDLERLLRSLERRSFEQRTDAERFLEGNPEYGLVLEQIAALKNRNPDLAMPLERELKSKLALTLDKIDRQKQLQVDEKTGQQMEPFGSTTFPKWEAHVEERKPRTVKLTFLNNEKTKGPGVAPKDIYGDVGLEIQEPDGSKRVVRLYEERRGIKEDDWRFARERGLEVRAEGITSSYMPQGEFGEFRKLYRQWGTPDSPGPLKIEFEAKRAALSSHYKTREKPPENRTEADTQWKTEYQRLLADYTRFYHDNKIFLLNAIDHMAMAPSKEEANGKGYVPEGSLHWTRDAQTEAYLEQMAEHFKMQQALQEGILTLVGHAGTGKDVLIKMFCERTHRPYFAFDCSKWTTEAELGEDIILDAEDGAPRTVKVPSILLKGMQTPGAMVYLNEWNAMPQQAHMFLHALLDEKRTVTRKTSPDSPIKAHPSVLFASSMNPGYEGTFKPQLATASRMVRMPVDYPPLTVHAAASDRNRNPMIHSAEALRIARSVDSLADLTYEPNPERNEFVKLWNKFVNGVDNDAPDPTPEQKFDLETILSLVEFGDVLRKAFVVKFEGGRDATARDMRKKLPVDQPLTLREMRRAAWRLSHQYPSEKKRSGELDPEKVAKELIDVYFLSHIDSADDRERVRQTMATDPDFTMKKRLAA